MITLPESAGVVPMREQIYAKMRALVSSDRAQPGQRLPPVRDLATHFSVSLTTALTALQMLEKEGFVSCEGRRGTYVRRTLSPSEVFDSSQNAIPTIGVLTGTSREKHHLQQLYTTWKAGILYGIQEELMGASYAMHSIPFDVHDEPLPAAEKRISKLVGVLSGMVMLPFGEEYKLVQCIDQIGLPWVTINQPNHLSTHNYVTADYYGAGLEVGKLFAQTGREHILFLQTKGDSYSTSQKEYGLRVGLRTHGASVDHVEICSCDSYQAQFGWEATTRYLQQKSQPPEAIFAMGDYLALGAMKACQERGLRVPEDVAVVGGTGIDAGEHSTPTLTTIQLPTVELGKKAAMMLLSMMQKGEKRVVGEILPAPLVLRGSTSPVSVGVT